MFRPSKMLQGYGAFPKCTLCIVCVYLPSCVHSCRCLLLLLTCYNFVWQKHRSSSKFTLQRSSGSSTHKTPNSESRSQANYTSDSSRWYDRLQYSSQSTSDNVSVDELSSRDTTKVQREEHVDVGASKLTNGSSVPASEDVVKKSEELQLAEETNDPPKTGMIDRTDPSVPHESPNCSSDLAKPVEYSDNIREIGRASCRERVFRAV